MAKAPASLENMDFENLSDGQLRELIQHARQTLGERIQQRLDEFKALAQEAGFSVTLSKLGEGGEPRRRRRRGSQEGSESEDRRGKVTAKYRNPDNRSETWSGRGRQPKWVSEKLAAGKSLDDFVIRGSGALTAREQAEEVPAGAEAE